MAVYEKFPKSFIERTQDDIEAYEGQYNVTNLINSCLGLIVIPKELMIGKLPKYSFDDADQQYGVTKKSICLCKDNNYSLNNIVRHIRNGLSHGLIKFESTDGSTINFIIISDRKCDKAPFNFKMRFTIEEFKIFALRVADDFLKLEEG
jgi:hypothetical protein